MTDLHDAALKGNVEEIQCLLTSGANVQAKSTNGLTILFIAVHEGHWNLLLFLILYGGESLFDDKQQVVNREHFILCVLFLIYDFKHCNILYETIFYVK